MKRGEEGSLLWHLEGSYRSSQWKLTMPTDVDAVSWLHWGKEKDVYYDEEGASDLNTDETLARFMAQHADGSLAKRTAWDRDARQTLIEKELGDSVTSMNAACGTSMKVSVAWDTIDDAMLKELSITSYCGDGLDALAKGCERYEDAKEQLADVNTYSCSFSEPHGLSRDAETLSWRPSGTNHDQLATAGVKQILGQNLLVAKSSSGLFMAFDTTPKAQKLFFGDGKEFQRQRTTWQYSGDSGGGILYPGKRASFKTGKTWTVECGRIKHLLKEISTNDKAQLLKNARFGEFKFEREPHTLARDNRGVYYYVDKRIEEAGGNDFNVYIGKKGAVEKTNLKDIVNDSEGQIFSTAKGDIRLLVGSESYWVDGKKKVDLKMLPTNKNEGLIYSDLGAYDGMASGSVCDAL